MVIRALGGGVTVVDVALGYFRGPECNGLPNVNYEQLIEPIIYPHRTLPFGWHYASGVVSIQSRLVYNVLKMADTSCNLFKCC